MEANQRLTERVLNANAGQVDNASTQDLRWGKENTAVVPEE